MDPINYASSTYVLASRPEQQMESSYQAPLDSFNVVSYTKEQQPSQRFQPYILSDQLIQSSVETTCNGERSIVEASLQRRMTRNLKKYRRRVSLKPNFRGHCSACKCVSKAHIQNRPTTKLLITHIVPEVQCINYTSIYENRTMNYLEGNPTDNTMVLNSINDRTSEEQSKNMITPNKTGNKMATSTTSTSTTLSVCEASLQNVSLHSNSSRVTCSVSNFTSGGIGSVSSTYFISNIVVDAELPAIGSCDQLLRKDYYPLFLKSDDSSILLCAAQSHSILMPTARLSLVAWHAANRIIRHARYNKTPNVKSLLCPDCNEFPNLPVTGKCGHTRCTKCIEINGTCSCGTPPPKNMFVNTVIQDLVEKLSLKESSQSLNCKNVDQDQCDNCPPAVGNTLNSQAGFDLELRRRRTPVEPIIGGTAYTCSLNMLMSPQSRFKVGRDLLAAKHYKKAAAQLARVAASTTSTPLKRHAHSLLVRAVLKMCVGSDVRRVTRDVFRLVRRQSGGSWVRRAELECSLCYHTYTQPVTTPCGHTYCRTCLERSMDYRKACALCLRSLHDFELATTGETIFICAALASIDALNPPLPMDPDVIPIFVCTVAFPAIPCPLFIFDPRYWLMIRRVLESGSRKFGMVAYERGKTYSDYGTILEVRDCVHLEDGRSFLSTVGVTRFKIIERGMRDGCDVARIQPLTDEVPTEERNIWDMRIIATQISYKALLWLNTMNTSIRSEIEAAFGPLPHFDCTKDDWWESPDGPAWLWWLVAILPLRAEIKILILSTTNLRKRMMAVSRTLDIIDHVALNATFSSDYELRNSLTSAEDWLETNA